jgi:hypothetical protein
VGDWEERGARASVRGEAREQLAQLASPSTTPVMPRQLWIGLVLLINLTILDYVQNSEERFRVMFRWPRMSGTMMFMSGFSPHYDRHEYHLIKQEWIIYCRRYLVLQRFNGPVSTCRSCNSNQFLQ